MTIKRSLISLAYSDRSSILCAAGFLWPHSNFKSNYWTRWLYRSPKSIGALTNGTNSPEPLPTIHIYSRSVSRSVCTIKQFPKFMRHIYSRAKTGLWKLIWEQKLVHSDINSEFIVYFANDLLTYSSKSELQCRVKIKPYPMGFCHCTTPHELSQNSMAVV